MKRLLIVLSIFLAGAIILAPAFNASAGSNRKADKAGGKAFKKYCRSCHDGSFKEIKKLSSKSRTSKQWADYFANNLNKQHQKLTDNKNGKKNVLKLVEKKLKNILFYLKKRAADKPSPATCG